VDPAQLLAESEAALESRWGDARLLPGALRLLSHLSAAGVPVAVATSTPRATFDKKLATKAGLRALWRAVVCGDEVARGKPSPDVFLAAAAALGAPPGDCVVFEDAPSGVQGALAAGMHVVCVPSLPDRGAYANPAEVAASGAVAYQILPSLLAFQPQSLGLPAFDDAEAGVVPLDVPLRLKGTVVKGFGRGSAQLGIPTANLDSSSLSAALAHTVTGAMRAAGAAAPRRAALLHSSAPPLATPLIRRPPQRRRRAPPAKMHLSRGGAGRQASTRGGRRLGTATRSTRRPCP
jgi:riboflavin kinase